MLGNNRSPLECPRLLFPDNDLCTHFGFEPDQVLVDLRLLLGENGPKSQRQGPGYLQDPTRISVDMGIAVRMNIARKWCDRSLEGIDQIHMLCGKKHGARTRLYLWIPGSVLQHGQPPCFEFSAGTNRKISATQLRDQRGPCFDVVWILQMRRRSLHGRLW